MAGGDKTAKLRRENEALMFELEKAKEEIHKLSEQVAAQSLCEDDAVDTGKKSIEFLSHKYDELDAFKTRMSKEIKSITETLEKISARSNQIRDAIDDIQDYSYQYNLKITGMPAISERESAEATSLICLKLFHAIGAKDVTFQDIDIAHRVPSRRPTNQPNAIVCKFVRRIAKEKVMSLRKKVESVHPNQLGFEDDISMTNLAMYDHLSPRIQELMYEAKKLKVEKEFKFCWAKNGAVYLRKTEESRTIKLRKIDDLRKLT